MDQRQPQSNRKTSDSPLIFYFKLGVWGVLSQGSGIIQPE